jgi:hypothetical protein
MKHHTRKPLPSEEVVTIGKATYDQLWAEAVASSTPQIYNESDGWMSSVQFAEKVGIHIKTARKHLERRVDCGTFEKAVGVNKMNIMTVYYRPLVLKNAPKTKNGSRK